MTYKRTISIVLLTLVFGLTVAVGLAGAKALTPDLKFSTLEGKKIDLADYRGRVVVVSFFASWCMPCRMEAPELVSLSQQYAPRGVQMIGLSLDRPTSRDDVIAFVTSNKINYPVGMIHPEQTREFGGVRSIPTIVVLNGRGEIVSRIVGFDRSGRLERAIEAALAG